MNAGKDSLKVVSRINSRNESIRGSCVGGGCEIAIASDLRFAAPDARFGITASKLGLVYPYVPTQRLVSRIGKSEARRISHM